LGDFEDNNFPLADNPADVEWMICSWKIVKLPECEHCIRGNYGLDSKQFDHMVIGTTRAQAVAKFREYVLMHKANASGWKRKNHVIFLTKVIKYRRISKLNGDESTDPEVDI